MSLTEVGLARVREERERNLNDSLTICPRSFRTFGAQSQPPRVSYGSPVTPQPTDSRVRGCAVSSNAHPFAIWLAVCLPLWSASLLLCTNAAAQAPATKPAVLSKPAASAKAPTPAGAPAAPSSTESGSTPESPEKAPPTLEETRLTLSKWIETQQIISKERNDWQQGKEILQGRIELVGKEVSQLRERITQSESAVAESHKKRDELSAQNEQLKEVGAQLARAVTEMESQVRKLAKLAPEGVATRLTPLLQRIPPDPEKTRISTAERFQNVLGILNELNKANSEITIAYEIRQLSDGSSSEVQVIYVGLAQAYFLSPRGEAGIGKPTDNGWQWRAANDQASAILTALEIIQGKHPPSFVALPITIQ